MDEFQRLDLQLEALGYEIKERGLDEGFAGDLCGKILYATPDLSVEKKAFIRLHLAGHAAQWYLRPDTLPFSESILGGLKREDLETFVDLEHEVHCLALGLIERVDLVDELSQWYADGAQRDLVDIQHYFLGESVPFPTFQTLAFPVYTPEKVRTVSGGIFVRFGEDGEVQR